ncbi:hypothetical protein GTA08_BOTSDO03874 [Neofusicoccum parvum]|nr:hypothetical protein GTA08_BOTSDO03874 [Neofusicoccum parvum]
MKTSAVVATILAAAGSSAAESPFRMLALSKGAAFDGTYLRGSAGRFVLGKQTNTTCGAVAPMFTSSNNTITTYGDGKQNVQMVSVDITGAVGGMLSYKDYPYNLTAEDVTDSFSQATSDSIQHLFYNNGTWLACPQQESGVYSVYADEAYSLTTGKQECIPFVIATQEVESPQVCTMS